MVFLDANILLELIIPGRAKYGAVRKLLENYQDVHASMLSVHLCWHFGRAEGVRDELIASILDSCNLLALKPEDYQWAKKNEQGKDFEDALQLACAARNGCKQFVTLDKNFAKRYRNTVEFVSP
jgi:predicted nucleic acid-binding protein